VLLPSVPVIVAMDFGGRAASSSISNLTRSEMSALMTDNATQPSAAEIVAPDTGLVSLLLILRFLGIAASPDGLKH